MLLLILFAGCLASCAAQSFQPAQALQTSDSTANVVAVLQAAVKSYRELNETTITPVLTQIYRMIALSQPDLAFTLRVKNITRV